MIIFLPDNHPGFPTQLRVIRSPSTRVGGACSRLHRPAHERGSPFWNSPFFKRKTCEFVNLFNENLAVQRNKKRSLFDNFFSKIFSPTNFSMKAACKTEQRSAGVCTEIDYNLSICGRYPFHMWHQLLAGCTHPLKNNGPFSSHKILVKFERNSYFYQCATHFMQFANAVFVCFVLSRHFEIM